MAVIERFGRAELMGRRLVQEINNATKDAADATTSSVDALAEYLKTEAVEEIRTAIDNGTATSENINGILTKYLNLEGSEPLIEWINGLKEELIPAIESGYYDKSTVQGQIENLNTAQENLQAYLAMKVIDDIMKAAGDGKPTQAMIDNAIKNSGLSPSMRARSETLLRAHWQMFPKRNLTQAQVKFRHTILHNMIIMIRFLVTFSDLAG